MNRISYGLLGFSAVLLAVGGWPSEPAQAQVTFSIGGFHIPIQIGRPGRPTGGGGCYQCGGGRTHHRHKDNDDSSDSDSARNNRDPAPSAPAMSTQTVLLKSIGISEPLGRVGVKNVVELGKTKDKDEERDWLKKAQSIIEAINKEQKKDTGNGRVFVAAGDVTEHAIDQSLETAFKNAKLDTFERFASENWTTERLRVKVLTIVEADLERLTTGTGHGNVPMRQLDELIQKAAQKTYARVFELSELLAANRESAQFMQRLYQTRPVDGEMREGTEPMIFRAANTAIAPFEAAMRQDANAYALRYRAQRIVFDCLSDKIASVSSSDDAAVKEVEDNILRTASTECVAWLEQQFGTQRDAVLPQKPLPQRVVWSETGPKDHPSMYTTQSDAR